jgi:serine/threonine protein kinase
LGQGAYGKVYLVNHKDKQYALKKLSKDFLMRTQKVNSVFRERDILTAGTDCKYIPNIYHTFSDEEYLYIVLEYISGGTLSDKLKNISGVGFGREQAQFYAAQLVVGLEYIQK